MLQQCDEGKGLIMNENSLFIHRVFLTAVVVAVLSVTTLTAAPAWHPLNGDPKPATPQLTLLEQDESHLLVRWDISGFFVRTVQADAEKFHRISFNGSSFYGSGAIGAPEIPFLSEMIRLPDGTQATAEIVSVNWVDAGQFNLYPKQTPRRDDGSPPPPFQKSFDAYKSNQPTPSENSYVGRAEGWGGVYVTGMSVAPIRYVPAYQQLEVASSITVRIDFVPGNVQNIVRSRYPSSRMNKLHQTALLNPPDPRQLDADEIEPVRMLFVMQEDAQEVAQPLIDFHHNTGLRADVWLVDDEIEPEDIRDEIRDRFEDGLEYLFIIGDGDEDDHHVPMFFWDPEDPGWQDPVPVSSHSDNWYCCLDEQVEFRDGDRYDDHLLELAVGRLTYERDELGELEVQVDKLMDYLMWSFEDQDDSEWLERAILVGHRELEDGERHYIECKRRVATYEYLFPRPEWTELYGIDDVDNDDIIENINEAGIGFFNYRGHGNAAGGVGWRQGQNINGALVNRMANRNRPFIYVSSACLNANIATYFTDCLIEKFQKHWNGASVSAHGSVISTYTSGNHFFDSTLFRGWFDEGNFDLGYNAVWTMAQMVPFFDNVHRNGAYPVIGRMNTRAYIWLGDPALEYRIQQPEQLVVDFDGEIAVGQDVIRATISAEEEPVEGARLCVRSEDDAIYYVGESDADGLVELELDGPLDEPIELFWGIYERNSIPDFGSFIIEGDVGAIRGQVTDFASGEAVEGVHLSINGFRIITFSDADGNFMIESSPAGERTLTAQIDGWLTMSQVINVPVDDTAEVNFALRFSQFVSDSAWMSLQMEVDDSTGREFTFSNSGNGPLRWSAELDFLDLFETIADHAVNSDDRRLKGVVLVEDHFYVAGGNNNGDPNYIYKIARNGNIVESRVLPDEISGVGLYDLAWDGEYLYGSSNATIYKLTLEGEIADRIDGPFNPNKCLAIDNDGNIWVGKDDELPLLIDAEGNMLNVIDSGDITIRGLAWYDDPDSDYDLIISAGLQAGDLDIYRADPTSGEVEYVSSVAAAENEILGDGLSVTDSYSPMQINLIGMVQNGDERLIRVCNIESPTDWISIVSAVEGSLEPDGESSLELSFSGIGLENDISLNSTLVFNTDGRGGTVEIPIILAIGDPQSVSDEAVIPQTFEIGQPYPNPFNAVTIIPINLSESGFVTAALYDLTGRSVRTIAEGRYSAGRHTLSIQAADIASGVYLIRVSASGRHLTRKVVLLR